MRFTEIGVVVRFSEYELDNQVSCGFGYTSCYADSYVGKQNYKDHMSVANQNLGQFIAVTVSKTILPSPFSVPKIEFSRGGVVVGVTSSGSLYRVRRLTLTDRVVREVLNRVGSDLSRVLIARF